MAFGSVWHSSIVNIPLHPNPRGLCLGCVGQDIEDRAVEINMAAPVDFNRQFTESFRFHNPVSGSYHTWHQRYTFHHSVSRSTTPTLLLCLRGTKPTMRAPLSFRTRCI
jgi:hypothetical protein